MATLLIISELPLEYISSLALFKESLAMPQPITELPLIAIPVTIIVLPIAILPSLEVRPNIHIPRLEPFCPLTLLQRVLELTFVAISLRSRMNTEAFDPAFKPFADVRFVGLFTGALPHTAAVFFAFGPLAVVDLAVAPREAAFAGFLAVVEVALVAGVVRVELETSTVF
jgi:hypothetical protein